MKSKLGYVISYVVILAGALSMSIIPVSAPGSATNGLLGRYWEDQFFSVPLPVYPGCADYAMPLPGPYPTPTMTRTDAQVCFTKFDDTVGPPNPRPWDWRPFDCEHHEFSVKWTGGILLNTLGIYEFKLESDDGSWLYIDGQLLINNGHGHPPGAKTASYENTASGVHDIIIDFYETCDDESGIIFSWKQPRGDWQIVPTEALVPYLLRNPGEQGVPEFGLELPAVVSIAMIALFFMKRRSLKITP